MQLFELSEILKAARADRAISDYDVVVMDDAGEPMQTLSAEVDHATQSIKITTN